MWYISPLQNVPEMCCCLLSMAPGTMTAINTPRWVQMWTSLHVWACSSLSATISLHSHQSQKILQLSCTQFFQLSHIINLQYLQLQSSDLQRETMKTGGALPKFAKFGWKTAKSIKHCDLQESLHTITCTLTPSIGSRPLRINNFLKQLWI
jgi:hypothetical protein